MPGASRITSSGASAWTISPGRSGLVPKYGPSGKCSISKVTLYVVMECPQSHCSTDAESGKRETVWQASVEYSGVEAARRLLRKDEVSDGFTTLWELKRLDLSVEKCLGLRSQG
jgi:hypothetical protein